MKTLPFYYLRSNKLRSWLKFWLEDEENPKKYLLDILISLLIIISIIIVFFQNENGDLPGDILFVDKCILTFFIIEYLARFYICSNFIYDLQNKGILSALGNKIKWMLRFSSLVDLLAIIPAFTYFRVFRTLRFLRILRVLRLFRVFKIFREIDKLGIIIKGMKEQNRLSYIFLGISFLLLISISFGLYIVESSSGNDNFKSISDSFIYVLGTIELIDVTPNTIIGRFFSILLLVFNIVILGFFISIIITKINAIMNAITNGKISNLNIKNHIVICGHTKSSEKVIEDLLLDKKNYNKIVLISEKQIQDIDGLIYVNADFTDCNNLKMIKIADAKFAIVFAETNEHDTSRDVDLRTVMTIFHIEKEAPDTHTIAEINDEVNAEIIKDKIKGDEILYKELIDARIISTCINNPNVSNLFYDLFGNERERIKTKKLLHLNIGDKKEIIDVKNYFNKFNQILIGVIDQDNNSILAPPNDMLVDKDTTLVYLV